MAALPTSCASSASARSTLPARSQPDIHIYTRSKLPWVRLPDGAMAVEAYYDSSQVWPAESLERRKALFG